MCAKCSKADMAPGGSDVGSYLNKGRGVRTSNVWNADACFTLKSGRYQTERTCL